MGTIDLLSACLEEMHRLPEQPTLLGGAIEGPLHMSHYCCDVREIFRLLNWTPIMIRYEGSSLLL